MEMPLLFIIKMGGCIEITRNCPSVRASSLSYVGIVYALAKCVATTKNGGLSANNLQPDVMVGVTQLVCSS